VQQQQQQQAQKQKTGPVLVVCSSAASMRQGSAPTYIQPGRLLQHIMFKRQGFYAGQGRTGTSSSSCHPTHKPHLLPADVFLNAHACSYGPGSTDGCLSVVPLDVDGSAAARRSAPPRRDADVKRNIYTSTPKKGGFGRPWKDNCLGDPPKYYSDVYEAGRALEKVRHSSTGHKEKQVLVKHSSNAANQHTGGRQLLLWGPGTCCLGLACWRQCDRL
jgi:hypothetical protein